MHDVQFLVRAGEHDDRDFEALAAEARAEVPPVPVRQAEVEDQGIEPGLPRREQGLGIGEGGRLHGSELPFHRELLRQCGPQGAVVIDDQYRAFTRHRPLLNLPRARISRPGWPHTIFGLKSDTRVASPPYRRRIHASLTVHTIP